ncbi:hypothetical protein CC1G_02308 [Coprinopsis cinerea okayama7|uniref:Uncharacterized protein n=1 Tax=Coprinopsis cinerea (strain Okayama-7 / 130 / ATCC MYA-4618 / FGSC 9003) TaxID=240176 RepID=A8N7Q1_COPC7|nr:hypothetical protein CC1G_02308 [Coprinopsis cinerea okayama7\|eukprot:XP_001830857.2 hypothetical protein CC1G_02308 [Coprinopsis cinerea okayama7\
MATNTGQPDTPKVDPIANTEFLEKLTDRNNETRKAIIRCICRGIYAVSGLEDGLDSCIQELLQLCNGSRSTMSKMLQNKIFNGQSPLRFILLNLPDAFFAAPSFTTAPPAIESLIAILDPSPGSSAFDEIVERCLEKDANGLFQLVNDHRYFSESDGQKTSYSAIHVKGHPDELRFTVPNFPERILTEERIDLRFIAYNSLWSFIIFCHSDGTWRVMLQLLKEHPWVHDKGILRFSLHLTNLGQICNLSYSKPVVALLDIENIR